MNNIEFFTNICMSVLNPSLPMTEEEKLEVLQYEKEMEEMNAEEEWPPYDIALEL